MLLKKSIKQNETKRNKT